MQAHTHLHVVEEKCELEGGSDIDHGDIQTRKCVTQRRSTDHSQEDTGRSGAQVSKTLLYAEKYQNEHVKTHTHTQNHIYI
jgi:hypothetical protein